MLIAEDGTIATTPHPVAETFFLPGGDTGKHPDPRTESRFRLLAVFAGGALRSRWSLSLSMSGADHDIYNRHASVNVFFWANREEREGSVQGLLLPTSRRTLSTKMRSKVGLPRLIFEKPLPKTLPDEERKKSEFARRQLSSLFTCVICQRWFTTRCLLDHHKPVLCIRFCIRWLI